MLTTCMFFSGTPGQGIRWLVSSPAGLQLPTASASTSPLVCLVESCPARVQYINYYHDPALVERGGQARRRHSLHDDLTDTTIVDLPSVHLSTTAGEWAVGPGSWYRLLDRLFWTLLATCFC